MTRVFAHELGVEYSFEIVADLLSLEAAHYGGNPALRVPSLRSGDETWFGALNVCRQLARFARGPRRVVWPEQLTDCLGANAQELVLQAMSTEVSLIMHGLGTPADAPVLEKGWRSLRNMLSWLDSRWEAVLRGLPAERDVSLLEISAFCLAEHLDFRLGLPTNGYPALHDFAREFAERPSARATPYRFDTP